MSLVHKRKLIFHGVGMEELSDSFGQALQMKREKDGGCIRSGGQSTHVDLALLLWNSWLSKQHQCSGKFWLFKPMDGTAWDVQFEVQNCK
jgi:hypothetical protein